MLGGVQVKCNWHVRPQPHRVRGRRQAADVQLTRFVRLLFGAEPMKSVAVCHLLGTWHGDVMHVNGSDPPTS